MKKIYLLIFVSVLPILNACDEWLDVNPRSEIRESVLFSTEDGYKHALTGAYILVAQSQLYGENASMYVPEALSRHWALPLETASLLHRLSSFDYTNSGVEALFSSLWLGYYKVIVQLNNILSNIETTEVVFSHGNDKLIKGEALGLRAFLHVEVLRLFGPVPGDAQPADIAIPYVTEMTKDPSKLVSISYAKVLELIEKDLNAAETLLEDDPIRHVSNRLLNDPSLAGDKPEDAWQLYRQSRFNYYAVLGTKARFYHWTGNKGQAVEYARQVVEAENADGSLKFPLTTETTFNTNEKSMVMWGEHLFGIENPDLQTIIRPLFKETSVTNAILTQDVAQLNTAYETGTNSADIRRPARYWIEKTYSTGTKIYHFLKYSGTDEVPTDNRVPLLRLAEMYLILIEDLSLGEATPYFSTYRTARSLDISVEAPSMDNDDARLARLEKEYRKEFYGEGQMFFFYKRHKFTSYNWPSVIAVSPSVYVIPKPKDQIKFE
jgi:hypothetical protein